MIEAMPGTPRLPGCARPAHAAQGAGAGRRRAPARRGRARGAARRTRRHRRLHAAALLLGGQRDHGAGDAGNGLHGALGGGAQRLQFLGAGRRHGDREEHLGIGDEDVGDQAEIHDIAGKIRPVDRPELLDDGFLGDCHVRYPWVSGIEIIEISRITKRHGSDIATPADDARQVTDGSGKFGGKRRSPPSRSHANAVRGIEAIAGTHGWRSTTAWTGRGKPLKALRGLACRDRSAGRGGRSGAPAMQKRRPLVRGSSRNA